MSPSPPRSVRWKPSLALSVADLPHADTVWAGYFGLIYRKFFWDFVSGTLRNPGGLQCVFRSPYLSVRLILFLSFLLRFSRPANQDAFFIAITVKAPVLPIFSIILGLFILALEYPAPFLKGTSVHRNLITRVILLLFQVFFAILFYQVRFPCHLCHR